MDRLYLCIDLKCFYASCECVERGLDPFKVNLVVADVSRGNGALCLAISPHMKEIGIHNRCRIFEIPSDVSYVAAMPRMKKYIEVSANVYGVYLKYIAKEDILVYSIDECFMDVTQYVSLYQMDVFTLAKKIIQDVYDTTGICATAGIGPNLFLCKVALDVVAKHVPDHIGYLDLESFKNEIWHHKPITDIWNIGTGIANRLLKYGVDDLYGVAHMNEELLYKEFGVNAEFLIDHSHGIEPCTIEEIHNYTPQANSLFNSQILFEDYSFDDAYLILKEMVEVNVLQLVDKGLVTNHISVMVRYNKDSEYSSTSVSKKLDEYTQSLQKLNNYVLKLYKDNVIPEAPIRGIGIGFGNVIPEEFATIDLFTDLVQEQKEKTMQKTILEIKDKYGKNALFKGMNLEKKATQLKRNKLIGGHNGE